MVQREKREFSPGPSADRWKSRPGAALATRGLVVLLPILLAVGLSILASRIVPEPRSLLGEAGWLVGLAVLSTLVLVVADRQLRRLLPLALLLKMTLVFPDQAPSRFNSALRMGSQRKLAARLGDAEAGGRPGESLNEAAVRLAEMAGTLMAHDRRTRGHSERVRAFAAMIGTELKLSERDLDRLQWAALLHDIGKLSVPAEILNKRGRPTDEEWQIIRGHPVAGRRFLEPVAAWLGPFANAAWEHHEKWDGTGYPAGLSADGISQAGRIVAVADAFEVMTATRSYKRPVPVEAARKELTACAGTHFDPVVVRALLSVSLGRLRKAAGPLAWVAQLPFLGWASPAGLPSLVPTVAGAALRIAAAATLLDGVSPALLPAGALAATSAPPAAIEATTSRPQGVAASAPQQSTAARSAAHSSVGRPGHAVTIRSTSTVNPAAGGGRRSPSTAPAPAPGTTDPTTTVTAPGRPPTTSTTTAVATGPAAPPSSGTSTTSPSSPNTTVSTPTTSRPAPAPTTTTTASTTTTIPPTTTTASTTTTAPTPTSLALSASPTTVTPLQSVTFVATVNLPVSVGTVTFTDSRSATPICTDVTVTGGQARCTARAGFFPGSVTVVATYQSGSVRLTSNPVQVNVEL